MSRLYKGGRPRKTMTERLNISMTDTEYLNLQRASEIMDCTMSEVVREGIRRVIRHLKSKRLWDNVPQPPEG